MAHRLAEAVPERTFQYQDVLPPLPVPALESSLSKYLDAVRPFSSEKEFKSTVDIVRKFREGVGKDLHQKLLQRAKSRRNWLEEWWLDSAYLEVRIPSQLNVNFGGPGPYLEHFWPPAEGTCLQRAGVITWLTLQYWDLLRTERLAPQKAGKTPMDMDQFRMLFCTCKVPGVKKDTIRNYFKTESEGPCPSHLVVMCRGRIFTFDALFDGQILTPPEIIRQLSYVKERCEREPEGDGVSALTSEERTRWAKAREHLISIDPHNKTILETVQSSLFVISLDETKPYSTPENYTNLTTAALTGDATIRWGDKSYNSIVFADGTFGSTCDHSPYDAMVLVSMCWYLDERIKATEGKWKGSDAVRQMPLPEELLFTVDEKILSDINQAKQQYLESTQDLQVVCYAFTAFGKRAIKEKKLHPDTFVQLAMQLAYYKQHKRPGSCYETATTRRFYHGRTETMRPCTQEAVDWCKAMTDPTRDANARRKAMLPAFGKHNKLMSEAQEGNGFDRHLLGLYLIAKEEGRPTLELFTDPLYSRSLVGYTTILGAVAPMVHQGYGFFYRIRDDRIVISITSWKSCRETDAASLFNNFSSSLHELLHLATTSQL
ncbi:peroxisomal carnitine O-octanoyltransferase isoform X2 [Kryptolebias marmoratus]|uniref:peroxisomal carnitine O-octanoyltransferase isoform X2 n=1 Tax=Kryptolebias marmoratus TaxID=37003 RepID=UPI0007F87F71|nr:peroxisomal carnitine O-octanoyltransferase isoform X2 [Kryptolebias marmoratus]